MDSSKENLWPDAFPVNCDQHYRSTEEMAVFSLYIVVVNILIRLKDLVL